MSSRNIISLIVVVVIVVVVGALLTSKLKSKDAALEQNSNNPAQVAESIPTQQVIEIGINGFAPMDFKVKAGGTVTFFNSDTIDHEIASNPHPTHEKFPILNIGLLKPGEKKDVKIDAPGTYTYHDHLNPQFTGSFNVQ